MPTSHKPRQLKAHHAAALREFDGLPDCARVATPVVAALLNCTNVTVWRRVRAGLLPKPVSSGPSGARWVVGQLRQVLEVEG